MKVLITGMSGLLAPYIAEEFLQQGTPQEDISGTYNTNAPLYKEIHSEKVNLSDSESVKLLLAKEYDVIIHCAALTDVDFCEREPEKAIDANQKMTATLASAVKKGQRLIYVSTEAVFHEKFSPSEEETPNPANTYAKTKYQGELAVQELGTDGLIVRTTIFGKNYNPQKNVKKMYEFLLQGLLEKKPTKVMTDTIFTPISTIEFSRILYRLINEGKSGIYHVTSDEIVSRYAFAQLFAKVFKLDPAPLHPVLIEELHLKAQRSRMAALNNRKVKKELNIEKISLLEQLREISEQEVSE